jgi:hypothetical protein
MNRFRKTRNSIKNAIDEDEMMSYDGSSGSYIDSDEDSEFTPSKRQRTISNVQHPGQVGPVVPRRPTRVPNLKIQNRNAVLARENRLRKKMLMEELENANDELQAENRKLQKMMKFKDRKNEELTKEVRYLKSVIANRTEIVSVLKSLPQAIAPKKEEKPVSLQYAASVASSETLSCDIYEENGIKDLDPFLPTFTDDFFLNNLDIATEWDEILKNPYSASTNFTDIPKLEIESPAASPSSSGVSSEHNYFYDEKILESIDNEEIEDSAGICVHINRGKVSLEFCAVCHNNATNPWIN